MKKTLIFSSLVGIIFFVASFLTLKDYNISWDETIHFSRGQAYLHYFLTGKVNYDDLPNINLQGTLGRPDNQFAPRRSFYQLSDFHNGEYFLNDGGGGHPPINDVLASISNYVFFQKLGLLTDINAYHLFNIVSASILVFVVAAFAFEYLGLLPALVSVLALTTYPLFWAESHFNIKDPPLAAFFAGFIWAFYKSLKNFSIKWLILSILFFSLGLGTKFNILFAVPIIAVYLIYRYGRGIFQIVKSVSRIYLLLLILTPLFSLGFLTIFWPFLWHDWAINLGQVFTYYKQIGTFTNYQPRSFYVAGFNTFPVLWVIYTSPPVVLIFGLIGVIGTWINRKKDSGIAVLWLIWFIVPILRVSLPGTTIYGGDRQIMEFLPALALLSGLGIYQIIKWTQNSRLVLLVCLLVFIWPIFILFKLHPNENVYFNFLIGGLKGAQSQNFPSWGNSLGNAYLQGITWINKNAPQNAKLSLIQGTLLNVPPIYVRKDIDFKSENWSGINRNGEYIMELTFNDTAREYNYTWEYVNNFLEPVYELKVDGVAILKIWKNDLENTKMDHKLEENNLTTPFIITKGKNFITVNLKKEVILSRVSLSYLPANNCFPVTTSYIETSEDGTLWTREKDRIPYPQIGLISNSIGNTISYYLAGKNASYLRFWLDNDNSCALLYTSLKITELLNNP